MGPDSWLAEAVDFPQRLHAAATGSPSTTTDRTAALTELLHRAANSIK
ncbi:hypothetical protein AB0M02_36750 [Actinoplanes sp. NPDC051861]